MSITIASMIDTPRLPAPREPASPNPQTPSRLTPRWNLAPGSRLTPRWKRLFQLYANLRPALTVIPGGRYDKIDLVVVRENLEGLYIGHEDYVKIDDDPHAVAMAMATGINTRAGSRRLLEYAFEHAVLTGRKKVTIVHKANIMKALTGIFLETGLELYEKKYKGRFELDTVIEMAARLRCAIDATLNVDQVRTGDLGGRASTSEFTHALAARISQG
jgi:isocitrate/isopropylmalate dehydrogenase